MKIGIDIGGSHVAVGVINENGKILEQFEKDFTRGGKKESYSSCRKFYTRNNKSIEK